MNMKLITTEKFGDLNCNFYRNINDDILLTREQIGQALEYANPDSALSIIHKKHKDRLDSLLVVTKLISTDGKQYDTMLYTERGIMEICRWSRQPKANIFMDWVWDIVEQYRHNELAFPAGQQTIIALNNVNIALQSLIAQNKSFDNRLKLIEDSLIRKPKCSYTTKWAKKMNPKYAALMEHFGVNRKELFRNLYVEFENHYPNIDLNQEVEDYCEEHGYTSCYTMDAISNNKPMRQAFEKMIDCILEQNNISVEPENTITQTIFSN